MVLRKATIARLCLCILLFLWAEQLDAQLIITGVIDGPLTGGMPKALELYASDDIPDLSLFGIGSANNGGGSDGVEFVLNGSAEKGDFVYVSYEHDAFLAFLGFSPDFISSALYVNGDDAIELFKNDVVIDVYGEASIDGTGRIWEYQDGWAYRKSATSADGTEFCGEHWSYSGINALDGEVNNELANVSFPVQQYSPIPIPVVQMNPSILTGFEYEWKKGPSDSKTLLLNGSNLNSIITLEVVEPFELSLNNEHFENQLVVTPSDGILQETTIWVRLKAGVEPIYSVVIPIVAKSEGATNDTLFCNGSIYCVPGIVINEVLADPDAIVGDANQDGRVSITDDEFVELVNIENECVDISMFVLSDKTRVRHVFPMGSIVQPGGAIVVFGGGEPKLIPGMVQTATGGSLGLNNSGDELFLHDAKGHLVCFLSYGSEAGDNQSITRIPDGVGEIFIKHSSINISANRLFSPGTRIDGSMFDALPLHAVPFPLIYIMLLFVFIAIGIVLKRIR